MDEKELKNEEAARANNASDVVAKSGERTAYDTIIDRAEALEHAKNATGGHVPETNEQRKARERKEARDKVISAISDGLSAAASIYGATHGVDVSPTVSASASTKARIEGARAKRNADDAAYYKAYQDKLASIYGARMDRRKMEAEEEYKKQQIGIQSRKVDNDARRNEVLDKRYTTDAENRKAYNDAIVSVRNKEAENRRVANAANAAARSDANAIRRAQAEEQSRKNKADEAHKRKQLEETKDYHKERNEILRDTGMPVVVYRDNEKESRQKKKAY